MPEHRREVQEGSEPLPGRHRLGVLDPHVGLGEVGQSLARRPPGSGQCRSALRAAATLRRSP